MIARVLIALLVTALSGPLLGLDLNEREGLGEAISLAVYDSLRKGDGEKALELLAEGTERIPNDPDILGIRGVVAAIAGENETARVLLENAVVWKQDNALYNYNLGNLLAQSGKAADWIRAKQLLLGVMRSGNDDLIERAGLTLLVNRHLPLLEEEAETIHGKLDSRSVFRPDNPRLSVEARAIIMDRLATHEREGKTVAKIGDIKLTGDLREAARSAREEDRFHELKSIGLALYDQDEKAESYEVLLYTFLAGVPFSANELGLLLALSRDHGSLVETIRIAGERVALQPQSLDYQTDYLYYRLIGKENVPQSLDSARRLFAEHPGHAGLRSTLALGLLRNERYNEAMSLLEGASINLSGGSIRSRLVYACVLSANGEFVVADGLRESIEESSLLPAEAELMNSY